MTQALLKSPDPEQSEKLQRVYDEVRRRTVRKVVVKPGYYDEDGVRQGGLIAFVREFWHVLEPETDFVDGWVLWAIVEHLEAVTTGQIKRLLINVPPGCMKSLLVDVFWPAWEWGIGMAHLRYVTFSYSATLTERDNNRFSTLIQSKEYRAMFPKVIPVKVGEKRVSNTMQGWKLASSVGGVGTGERGNRVILDDPNNVKEAESEIVRGETNRWFRESMSNRLNSLEDDAIIVIMQRLHEDDVSGTILALGLDYCHLMIPMEYDWGRQVDENGEPFQTDIGWIDPRYHPNRAKCDGVLMWDERFTPQVIENTKKEVGPYAYAGQYMQTPAPRGGGIFKRDWWQIWEDPTGRDKFPEVEYIVASLDSAFTEDQMNDPSGMVVLGIFRDEEQHKRVIVLDAWRKHLEFSGELIEPRPNESRQSFVARTRPHWGLMEWVAHTCNRFSVDKLLIEAKASGISAAQELRRWYGNENWAIQLCQVKGDKVSRALGVQAVFSQGMVYAPVRDWAELLISDAETFPKGRYKDMIDALTQGIAHLRAEGMLPSNTDEVQAAMARVTHKKRLGALYKV